jgi:hypothetical protein
MVDSWQNIFVCLLNVFYPQTCNFHPSINSSPIYYLERLLCALPCTKELAIMAPRTRARARRPSNSLTNTQFGELDTTPTSRHMQFPLEPNKTLTSSPKRNQKQPTHEHEFGSDGLDVEMMQAADGASTKMQQSLNAPSYPWSEPDSQTRRSSPVQDEETQRDIWEFYEDVPMSQFSSNLRDADALPDTVPLAKPELTSEPNFQDIPNKQEIPRMVDLSETASTAQRSSPYRSDLIKTMWDLDGDDELELNNQTSNVQNSPDQSFRVPLDNCYDATPPHSNTSKEKKKGTGPTKLATQPAMEAKPDNQPIGTLGIVKGKSPELGLVPITPATTAKISTRANDARSKPQTKKPVANTSSPTETRNPRKRKQRAKSPLKFDEKTQVIKQHVSESSDSPKEPKSRKRVKGTDENQKAEKQLPAKGKKVPPAKRYQPKRQVQRKVTEKKSHFSPSEVVNDQDLPAEIPNKPGDDDNAGEAIGVEPTADEERSGFKNECPILDSESEASIYVASSPVVSVPLPVAARVKEDHIKAEEARKATSLVQSAKQHTAKVIEDSEASPKRLSDRATRTRNKAAAMAPKRAPLSSIDPNRVSKSVTNPGHTGGMPRRSPNDTAHNKFIRVGKPTPKQLVRTISVSERGSPVRNARNNALNAAHDPSLESLVDSFDLERVLSSHESSSSREEVLARSWRAAERRRASNGARRLIDYAVASDSSTPEADAGNTIHKATRPKVYLPQQRANGSYFSSRLSQVNPAVADHISDTMGPDQREFGRMSNEASPVYQQLHQATDVSCRLRHGILVANTFSSEPWIL